MNRHQKHTQHRTKTPAYRQAFERLDEALEENTQSDNSEKIQLMRLALFGDVVKLQQSGKVKIPK